MLYVVLTCIAIEVKCSWTNNTHKTKYVHELWHIVLDILDLDSADLCVVSKYVFSGVMTQFTPLCPIL